MSTLEQLMRRFITVMAATPDHGMPLAIRESLWEHRHRTDSEGYTLCFGGPLREQLLDLVVEWLVLHRSQHAHSQTQLSFFEETTP